MTYFNKKNPWFWAFIFLLILNISAIGTMLYTINRIPIDPPPPPPPPMENQMPPKIGKILHKQMGYSNDQIKVLHTIRLEHMKKMRKLQLELKELQSDLFNEISSTKYDSQKANTLKAKILKTHASMIDESNAFYLKVKENSSKEQLIKLNRFYKNRLFHNPRDLGNNRRKRQ